MLPYLWPSQSPAPGTVFRAHVQARALGREPPHAHCGMEANALPKAPRQVLDFSVCGVRKARSQQHSGSHQAPYPTHEGPLCHSMAVSSHSYILPSHTDLLSSNALTPGPLHWLQWQLPLLRIFFPRYPPGSFISPSSRRHSYCTLWTRPMLTTLLSTESCLLPTPYQTHFPIPLCDCFHSACHLLTYHVI